MRNGRPWAVRIMPAFVCVFAAFVVGYGLGEQAAALAICRSCPVIGECRRFADEHNRINGYQLQGIWGGRRYGVK